MSKRTITLTGRPPVTVDEATWPLIASAKDHVYDGQYDFQSFRHSRWFIGVRQHSDGRAIVYATYSYEYAGRDGLEAKAGRLCESDEVVSTIGEVADSITEFDHNEDEARQWFRLAAECIADLPAEDLG